MQWFAEERPTKFYEEPFFLSRIMRLMKAKFSSRLAESKDRTALGEIAPLGTPFVLIVDPSSQCNFRCRFCPTGHPDIIKTTGRYQGSMLLDAFYKIIDDLEYFPDPIKVLRLYKEGEPLMNKDFAKMVAYARRSDKVIRIDTTTNGALLTPENSEKIIDAGIDQINVSVNGVSDDHFVMISRARVNFNEFVRNIRYLYSIRGGCVLYVKAIKENLSENDQKRFVDIFGDIADRIFFEHLFPNWPCFEDEIIPKNSSCALYGGPVKEQVVCPYIFYCMTVNSDGSVSLCVQDWAHRLIVGDINQQSLVDIWRGKSINKYRNQHLAGRRIDNSVCAECGVMSYSLYDDIDTRASEIRERLDAGLYYGLR